MCLLSYQVSSRRVDEWCHEKVRGLYFMNCQHDHIQWVLSAVTTNTDLENEREKKKSVTVPRVEWCPMNKVELLLCVFDADSAAAFLFSSQERINKPATKPSWCHSVCQAFCTASSPALAMGKWNQLLSILSPSLFLFFSIDIILSLSSSEQSWKRKKNPRYTPNMTYAWWSRWSKRSQRC